MAGATEGRCVSAQGGMLLRARCVWRLALLPLPSLHIIVTRGRNVFYRFCYWRNQPRLWFEANLAQETGLSCLYLRLQIQEDPWGQEQVGGARWETCAVVPCLERGIALCWMQIQSLLRIKGAYSMSCPYNRSTTLLSYLTLHAQDQSLLLNAGL